jgi:hypothetical protein
MSTIAVPVAKVRAGGDRARAIARERDRALLGFRTLKRRKDAASHDTGAASRRLARATRASRATPTPLLTLSLPEPEPAPSSQVGAVGRVARHQLGATPAQLGKGNGVKVQMSRWKGMDEDISDDQQDIARGRGMVDSKFQGGFGLGGTQVRLATSPPARDRTRRISRKSAFVAVPATDFRRFRNGRSPPRSPRSSAPRLARVSIADADDANPRTGAPRDPRFPTRADRALVPSSSPRAFVASPHVRDRA